MGKGFTRYGRKIEVLHVELSSRCNLACPGCGRTLNPLKQDERLTDNLSLSQLKAAFTKDELSVLRNVYACGNIGDPVMAPEILEIFGYLREINPDVHLAIHTNGALRNASWWAHLVRVLGPNHRVIFGIDGLEDTNHLYRVNAVWEKLMKNVEAFISAGGHATWAYLVFDHNKHQVEEARTLAKTLGFKAFETRFSHRPEWGDVKYIRGENFGATQKTVRCSAYERKEIYLDARGNVYPCCFLGDAEFHYPKSESEVDWQDFETLNFVPMGKKLSVCEKQCSVVTARDDYEHTL